MKNDKTVAFITLGILAFAGFFLPAWPFAAVTVAGAAVLRYSALALCLAFFFDLVWGAPSGMLGAIYFPFVALALIVMVGREVWFRYFFRKSEAHALY